jgi:hypothetical protein
MLSRNRADFSINGRLTAQTAGRLCIGVALPGPRPITEFECVDSATFRDVIRPARQPAIMRGLARDWPAVTAARRSDEELVGYLRQFWTDRSVKAIVGPPEIEGRFLYNEDLSALNFGQGVSSLEPIFEWLLKERGNPRPLAMAVQSEPIPDMFPGFQQANRIDLIGSDVIPRAWIGNRIRVAPHYDLMENIGIVVAGRRRFILFPPEELGNLYVGPFELTPAGTPVSLVDPLHPDLERFPKFAQASNRAQTAELDPGDAIYMPYHWWHGVDSLEPVNLFVNYWWNDRHPETGNPYDALMFALYAIKALPADQRDVWKTVFDHYVFGANGDPAEHLPERAKGVLGELDAARLEQLRSMLRDALQQL